MYLKRKIIDQGHTVFLNSNFTKFQLLQKKEELVAQFHEIINFVIS